MSKELGAQAYAVLHRHPDGQEMTRFADSTMPIKVAWRNPPDKSGVLLVLGAHEVQREGGPDLRERVSRTISEWIGSHREEGKAPFIVLEHDRVTVDMVTPGELAEGVARMEIASRAMASACGCDVYELITGAGQVEVDRTVRREQQVALTNPARVIAMHEEIWGKLNALNRRRPTGKRAQRARGKEWRR